MTITAELALGITGAGVALAVIISFLIIEFRIRRHHRRVPHPRPSPHRRPPRSTLPTRHELPAVTLEEVRMNAFGDLETLTWRHDEPRDSRPAPRVNEFGELT